MLKSYFKICVILKYAVLVDNCKHLTFSPFLISSLINSKYYKYFGGTWKGIR